MIASPRPIALQARVLPAAAVPQADREAWRALAAQTPQFASPLLGPEFAAAVGRVRDDARVALFEDARGELVGVLAHHRRPGGVARPIGAPWSDAHALITAPGRPLDWRAALAAAGLRAYRFSHLVDPHGVCADAPRETAPAHLLLTPEGGGEAAWERLRAASPKRFKNIRRLEHKLEREFGVLEFGPDRSRAALDTLVGWKREQFARTGAHDVLHPAWSRALMDEVFALAAPGECAGAQGRLYTLRAAGRLVAGHFGLQQAGVFHPWLAAYDPALSPLSPGMLFMSAAVREAERFGVRRYELSTGSDDYKTVFSDTAEPCAAGVASLAGERAPRLAARLGGRLLERVRSRLDFIAEAEITLADRVHGVAMAVIDARRLAAAPSPFPPAGDAR